MYSISHADHPIPNVALSAISGSRIYYIHDSFLHLYRIGEEEPRRLFEVGDAQGIFLIEAALFILRNNMLMRYRQTEYSAILLETLALASVPCRVAVLGAGAVFIYAAGAEIFVKGLHRLETGSHGVLDICNIGDSSHVLTSTGDVFVCPDITVSLRLSFRRRMSVLAGDASSGIRYSRIDAVNGCLVLSNGEYLSKYQVRGHCLLLDYELAYEGRVIGKFLCGEGAAELEGAPFLCVNDRLYNVSETVGLAANKVYFFNRVEKESWNDAVEYTGWCPGMVRSVNIGRIAVPEAIRDEILQQRYARLVEGLEQYVALCDSVQPTVEGLSAREKEIGRLEEDMRQDVEEHAERAAGLRRRIAELEERAGRVMAQGDVRDFHANVERLKGLIDGFKARDFGAFRHRLVFQRAALKSKIMK